MSEINAAWVALQFGGPMVYPLLFLGIIAMAIILDRAVAYFRCLRLPQSLLDLVETYGFGWDDLERELKALAPVNVYGRFFSVIAKHRNQPAWWVESRAGDEAGSIEKIAGSRLVGARDGGHSGAIDGTARHDYRHDAGVQGDRRLGPGRAHTGDLGCRASADRDSARIADRDFRAIRLQLLRADAIAGARSDGATRIAADRSYPPGSGEREDEATRSRRSRRAERRTAR